MAFREDNDLAFIEIGYLEIQLDSIEATMTLASLIEREGLCCRAYRRRSSTRISLWSCTRAARPS